MLSSEYASKMQNLNPEICGRRSNDLKYVSGSDTTFSFLKKSYSSIVGEKPMTSSVKYSHFQNSANSMNPANTDLFKVNNRNTRKRWEICSKLIKTPERRHWHIWNIENRYEICIQYQVELTEIFLLVLACNK